ncbi:MAG TPA: MBL fold metallo-hydrolase [Candidatus Krumholzibacterium sp.]|nr:MBL fold metallo-hydrolase [Candidatus Krumholzibacterium sp.]
MRHRSEKPSIRITMTGTGTIIPEAGRACTSVCFEAGDARCLLDCGPGVVENLDRAGDGPGRLDHVFISHLHPDHTLGLPRLFSAVKNGWGGPSMGTLAVTGPEGTGEFLAGLESAWPGLADGMELSVREIDGGDRFAIGPVTVTAARADHGRRPALSFRVDHGPAGIVYTGDTALTSGLADLAAGADMIVCECSFTDDRKVEGHMSPSDVVSLMKASGALEVVLVHQYPPCDRERIASLIRERLDLPVSVARDGDTFDLPRASRAR